MVKKRLRIYYSDEAEKEAVEKRLHLLEAPGAFLVEMLDLREHVDAAEENRVLATPLFEVEEKGVRRRYVGFGQELMDILGLGGK